MKRAGLVTLNKGLGRVTRQLLDKVKLHETESYDYIATIQFITNWHDKTLINLGYQLLAERLKSF